MTAVLSTALVNRYLAHKHHLLAAPHPAGVVQVTRDIVALHATEPTTPYLSLWARVPGFQRQALEHALYEQRALVRVICMRVTLHAVPADELPFFFQAYTGRHLRPESRRPEDLLVWGGICQEDEAAALLEQLHRRVVDVLAERGPSTLREISQAVPELKAKIRHSAGKAYEGEFSVGSRLVPDMYALGLLVRARPRGTWRSNLHEYAALSDWLPHVNLNSVSPEEAQAWLVHRYLSAFGPATPDDVQWWTGFTKGETQEALRGLKGDVQEVTVDGLAGPHLMLADDARRLGDFAPPSTPCAFLLPALDPYIMGYRDRRRFLDPEQRKKVFDRAGNAVPTAWADGRVVGAWGQRKDGSVVLALFEDIGQRQQQLLEDKRQEMEGFLEGEFLPPRTRTSFTRALE